MTSEQGLSWARGVKAPKYNTECKINTTVLLSRPSRSILPRFSRPPIVCDNDKCNYTALINRQSQVSKDEDTHGDNSFLPTGSTVAVQCEDRGPLIHGRVVGHGTEDHIISYKIQMKKTRSTITRWRNMWRPPRYQWKNTSGMRWWKPTEHKQTINSINLQTTLLNCITMKVWMKYKLRGRTQYQEL